MKRFLLICTLLLAVSMWLSFSIVNESYFNLDIVEVNAIARQIEESWPDALSGQLPESIIKFTFVQNGLPLNSYITHRDTFIDVEVDDQIVGKVVIFNENAARLKTSQLRLTTAFGGLTLLLAVVCGLFALNQYQTILQPFQKLESFASRVAQGDLDFPLEMDRRNRFGAFSESFDVMREQLAIARENEKLANISKKELVASLSHDIKTPVASIKAIAELYSLKNGPVPELTSIIGKADQINSLISNMFMAALEELQQLKVTPVDIVSSELTEIIHSADYKNKLHPFILPECVVTVDRLRFSQVIDNIIENSYKYADTDIALSAHFEECFLVLTLRDFGDGVTSEELPFLREKYYRAGNADRKSGSGLGLYLSDYFLTEMGGSLLLESKDGFWVTIKLKI